MSNYPDRYRSIEYEQLAQGTRAIDMAMYMKEVLLGQNDPSLSRQELDQKLRRYYLCIRQVVQYWDQGYSRCKKYDDGLKLVFQYVVQLYEKEIILKKLQG